MRKLIMAAMLLGSTALCQAADLPVYKALASGYPTKCGFYYGLGTGGSAGLVNDAAVGTRIVQGELDALVGYTCPFMTDGFWFIEGSIGFNNLNGTANGLALSGPLVLIQRAGAGSPINALFNPFGNQLAIPSLPLLPANVTTSPGTPYAFVGLIEQDVGTQIGLDQHSHQWLIAPMLGVGLLTRLSNGVAVDTWAGYQMNSQSFCPGSGINGCARLGNATRVGVSFKY